MGNEPKKDSEESKFLFVQRSHFYDSFNTESNKNRNMTNYFSGFFHIALRDNFCQNEIDSITVFVSGFSSLASLNKLKENDKKLQQWKAIPKINKILATAKTSF